MATHARGYSPRDGLVALALVAGVNALGALPAVFVGSDTDWVERPWFYRPGRPSASGLDPEAVHPPEIAFPVVWTLLFTLMGVALFLLWRRGRPGPTRRRAVSVA